MARECGCGTCASIEFALDGVPVLPLRSDETLLAYDVRQDDPLNIGNNPHTVLAYDVRQDALVIVHIINDVIRELEVAPVQDTVVTTPNPAALDFSGWSEP